MKSPASAGRIFGLSLGISALAIITSLGVLGCGRAPAEPAAAQGRARALERRCVQLEQDYRTVAEARDAAHKELSEARAQLAQQRDLLKQLRDVSARLRVALADQERTRTALIQRTVERDNLRTELAARMNEREALTSRCEKLRKGLQVLLTQDDPAGPAAAVPAAPGTEPAVGSE
jgi:predicted RNase H-like nuclease (RuvC/YqgF family)